jgi:AcrR family transcriptional regulator
MAVTALTEGVGTDVRGGAPTAGGRTSTDPPSVRVLTATIACLGRWGMAKTTLDDIAREAGCSRATVYRLFPGGKETVVTAATAAEVERLVDRLAADVTAAASLEDAVVAGITGASRAIRDHAALQYLLLHEPEQVLPHLAFGRFDVVLAAAGARVAPWLETHVGAEAAPRAAEWLVRLVVSYSLAPSTSFDLAAEPDARRFTRTFIVPGLLEVSERRSHHG